MTRLWNSQRPALLDDSRLVWFRHGGVFHAMACHSSGDISLHVIEDQGAAGIEALLAETGHITVLGEMRSNDPFQVVPAAFKDAVLPDSEASASTISHAEGSVFFQMHHQGQHPVFAAAQALYRVAKDSAANHENLVYAWQHQGWITVLFFRKGQLELANAFPAANENEMLYFLAAPVKQAGLEVTNVHFEFLSEPEEAAGFLKTANRYLPHISTVRIELPYPAGEYPPYASVAFLLYQYLQCELQAAS